MPENSSKLDDINNLEELYKKIMQCRNSEQKNQNIKK